MGTNRLAGIRGCTRCDMSKIVEREGDPLRPVECPWVVKGIGPPGDLQKSPSHYQSLAAHGVAKDSPAPGGGRMVPG